MTPDFLPVGDCGVRVCFGAEISPRLQRRVQRFCMKLEYSSIVGVTEWVPAYATVTVYYQPWRVKYEPLCRALQMLNQKRLVGVQTESRLIEIPVCYGGEFGPDLLFVAGTHGLTPAQVIARHCQPRYLVYFLGFLPGFGYLGGLPRLLATPRRATPRSTVPAGSVGIAGAQTGVYPQESPGGWQIIGRTPLRLYDPARQPAALLRAGDNVKFVPMTAQEYEKAAHEPY